MRLGLILLIRFEVFNQSLADQILTSHTDGSRIHIWLYHDPEATSAYNENLSDISTLKDPLSKDASQRYHTHQYTNGTTYDLTNQPRESEEVRFLCLEPKTMISSINRAINMKICSYSSMPKCYANIHYTRKRDSYGTP